MRGRSSLQGPGSALVPLLLEDPRIAHVTFAVFPILANMRKLDTRLLAAARGLGAGRWFTFRTVFFPLMQPGVLGAFVMVLVFSLGFFVTPAILGGGRVLMVAEYVFIQITQTSRWGFMHRAAAISGEIAWPASGPGLDRARGRLG